jgi:hypothetical protein
MTVSAIAPSPRRLNQQERDYADIMTTASFRSDRQRIAEMIARNIGHNAIARQELRQRVAAKVGRDGVGQPIKSNMRRAIGK